MSQPTVHLWSASDGVELAYHELGGGAPVILLHGLFSDAQMNWVKFGHAARIAAAGLRVIMPDLRAHGQSGKPHDARNYSPDILVRDLHELIGHLELEEFDLGGFSLGSRTVIQAVIHGVRPRRAVLAGTGIEVLTNWQKRAGFYLEAIAAFDSAPRGDPHWLAIQFMRTMNVDRAAAALLLGALKDHGAASDVTRAMTMPTLVVCGADDGDNGPAGELAAMLPAGRFVEIPGSHMSSVTKPELGAAIARFLAA